VTDWGDIVGAENARRGAAPDAVDGVVPGWVVRPGSVGEVQACVRATAAAGLTLVPTGLGTYLDRGAPPSRMDVLLRLDRLAGVVDHQAADMTVTVEAGCRLDVLAAALGTAGQWLPLDPPAPARTTVGGLIAADLSGPLRAAHGRVRDALLGIHVVAADGALVRGGGRVVKNVAGYDLPKLHVGALGTVGVVVEATFKVGPRPPCEEAVVIAARTATVALELARAVLDSDVVPHWLEVTGPGGLAEGPGDGAAVAVGLAGIAEEVAHARARTLALAAARGLRAVPIADGAGLRARLAAFPLEPAAAMLRAATLPSDVSDVMLALEREAAAAGSPVRCLAHAANGVVRAAVARPDAVAPVVAVVRPRLEARGGSLVVERATPEVKRQVDAWGDPGPGLPLMRRVKEAFDPAHVLAPGRFVGGI
jgi:glycolate oxidase FAD binding subunit